MIYLAVLGSFFFSTASLAVPEPHQQMLDAVSALRQNDLDQMVRGFASDQEYARMASEWELLREQPISDEDRAKFNAGFGMLLAPDAENMIMAMLEPQLQQMATQWSSMVPLYAGLATVAVNSAESMGQAEKVQAIKLIQAIGTWARKSDLTNPDLARRAIGEIVTTAKSLRIQSLDDLRALSLDEVLTRAGTSLATAKRVLDLYGISIDGMLDSFTAETVARQADTATVKVGTTLFGQRIETMTELKLVDGRWISPEAQESITSMTVTDSSASPTEVQEMPKVTVREQGVTAPGNIQPAVGLSAGEMYLKYRDALQYANTLQHVTGFWMPWVAETSESRDETQRAAKLDSLRRSANNVQITGQSFDGSRVVLDVVGTNDAGEPLDGTVVMKLSARQWRIDDITWSPRALMSRVAVSKAMTSTSTELPSSTGDQGSTADPTLAEAQSGGMHSQSTNRQLQLDAEQQVAILSNTEVTPSQPVTADAKQSVQQSLDRNPFLKRYQVQITAMDLTDGFLTAEISIGPESLLRQVRAGFDLVDGDLRSLNSDLDRQAALAVRKSINVIRGQHNLLAVLMVAAPVESVSIDLQSGGEVDTSSTVSAESGATEPDLPTAEDEATAIETAKREEEKEAQTRQEQVRQIQTRLNELGYPAGVADGKAGKGTRGAIRSYQSVNSLPVNGEPSDALLAHMNSGEAVANSGEPQETVTKAEPPEEESKIKKLFGNIFKKKDKE